MMTKKITTVILLGLVLVGGFFRITAFQNNKYIHGDIWLNLSLVKSIVTEGRLVIPYPADKPYYYDPSRLGGRFSDQHPPLWPMLGAAVMKVFNLDNSFNALKLITLLSGVLLIYLAWLTGKTLFDDRVGLFAAALVTCSFLLIDYSANGALYILQANLYLLLILINYQIKDFKAYLLNGAILGIGYLLNYQNVILVLAVCLYYLMNFRRDLAGLIKAGLTTYLPALLIISPWLLANYYVFGDPFYNVTSTYYWQKLGLSQ